MRGGEGSRKKITNCININWTEWSRWWWWCSYFIKWNEFSFLALILLLFFSLKNLPKYFEYYYYYANRNNAVFVPVYLCQWLRVKLIIIRWGFFAVVVGCLFPIFQCIENIDCIVYKLLLACREKLLFDQKFWFIRLSFNSQYKKFPRTSLLCCFVGLFSFVFFFLFIYFFMLPSVFLFVYFYHSAYIFPHSFYLDSISMFFFIYFFALTILLLQFFFLCSSYYHLLPNIQCKLFT